MYLGIGDVKDRDGFEMGAWAVGEGYRNLRPCWARGIKLDQEAGVSNEWPVLILCQKEAMRRRC